MTPRSDNNSNQQSQEKAGGPLQGLKVVEMAAIGPVPFTAMMLADMGADVVRVERSISKDSSSHNAMDRGRQNLTLNLKKIGDLEQARRLIAQADVILEGFRPGVMERLGLGPETCMADNPRLIYGRMTGWGQQGPLAASAGHDLNYIALSGALHAMADGETPPRPPLNLIGDYGGGGMLLMSGVLAALHERTKSARGQVIDAAMSDGTALLMSLPYALYNSGRWTQPPGKNLLDGGAPFYQCYKCADGKFISIAPIEPQFYEELLLRCGVKADKENSVLLEQMNQKNWPRMQEQLKHLFATRSRDQWCELLEGTDACFAPVLSMAEAPEHPHNRAREIFVSLSGQSGKYQPAPAPRFSRTPSSCGAGPTDADIDAIMQRWSAELSSIKTRSPDPEVEQLAALQQEAQFLKSRLEKLETTDTLTGLNNRRSFSERLRQEHARIQRGNRTACLLLANIDHFRHINEQYGHDMGDQVLVRFAGICHSVFRQYDVVCRWGDREFLILLPATDKHQAGAVADRLHQTLTDIRLDDDEQSIRLTVSVAIITMTADKDIAVLLRQLDDMLVEAKSAGRNVTVLD
jgi:alpha-methylacyl-CoA racemase